MARKPDLSAAVQRLLKHYTAADVVKEVERQDGLPKKRKIERRPGRPRLRTHELADTWIGIEYLRGKGMTEVAARKRMSKYAEAWFPGIGGYSPSVLKELYRRARVKLRTNPKARADWESRVKQLLEAHPEDDYVVLTVRRTMATHFGKKPR